MKKEKMRLKGQLSTVKTILPLRNARAEHGRFSDKFPLRASAHPADRFV